MFQSSYGGYKELKRLVKEAHKRGIGIMLDPVYNHVGFGSSIWDVDGWGGSKGSGIFFYQGN